METVVLSDAVQRMPLTTTHAVAEKVQRLLVVT